MTVYGLFLICKHAIFEGSRSATAMNLHSSTHYSHSEFALQRVDAARYRLGHIPNRQFSKRLHADRVTRLA